MPSTAACLHMLRPFCTVKQLQYAEKCVYFIIVKEVIHFEKIIDSVSGRYTHYTTAARICIRVK